ncbi:hypothetical protein Btru_017725 [Bulinus truncatus]|nr:hypothetical protein Btru_017725 [Bulinus truncatus]
MKLVIWISLVLIKKIPVLICQAVCPPGWFGSKCQYLCHCDTIVGCDVSGERSTKCDSGWFGLACQYQDLTSINGTSITTNLPSTSTVWLTDRNATTCNDAQGLLSVTVSWDTAYPITWFRVQVNDEYMNNGFRFTLTTVSYQTLSCNNSQISIVNARTVDYKCQVYETVQQLTVTGSAVKDLCSLYINGGRNFALKQKTDQTGIYYESGLSYPSTLAVDGNTNSHLYKGSCSHTTDNVSLSTYPASWTLTFDSPKMVNRFVLVNRADCCSARLQHFLLETYDLSDNKVRNYQDSTNISLIYTVTTLIQKAISKIRVLATVKETIDIVFFVTLCEVFLYGGTSILISFTI